MRAVANGELPADGRSLPRATIELDIENLETGIDTPTTVELRASLDPDGRRVQVESARGAERHFGVKPVSG